MKSVHRMSPAKRVEPSLLIALAGLAIASAWMIYVIIDSLGFGVELLYAGISILLVSLLGRVSPRLQSRGKDFPPTQ